MTSHTVNLADTQVTNTTNEILYLDFFHDEESEIILPSGDVRDHVHGRLDCVKTAEMHPHAHGHTPPKPVPWEPMQSVDASAGQRLVFVPGDHEHEFKAYLNDIEIKFKHCASTKSRSM